MKLFHSKKTLMLLGFAIIATIILGACFPENLAPVDKPVMVSPPATVINLPPTLEPTAFSPVTTPLPSSTPTISVPTKTLIFANSNYNFSNMMLIGGFLNEEWMGPDEALNSIKGTLYAPLHYYAPDGSHGSAALITLYESDSPVNHCTHTLHWATVDTQLSEFSVGLLSTDLAPAPPLLEELSPKNETYRQLVGDCLSQQSFTAAEIEIKRIVRLDLENDGVDEVLIEATHFADDTGHSISPGSYSIILLRKVDGNDVSTQLVVGDIYDREENPAFPYRYVLQSPIDVNGDGKLEIFVAIYRWEGNGTIMYELENNTLVERLRMFCHL